jgi:hypothetical protein
MKISMIFLFLLLPLVSSAQNYQGMNEADMQKMMQQMQKMQTCMEDVDQSKLKALEQRSRKLETEVKSLCAEGKRDKAQKKALSFGKDVVNDPTMKIMRKCGEMMKDVMPKMSFTGLDKDSADRHICDEL